MKPTTKHEKLKSNSKLLRDLHNVTIDPHNELMLKHKNLFKTAADRIEALVAALIEMEIKLKTG